MSANMIDLLLKSLGETCYMVLIAIVLATLIGLPLGVILTVTRKDHIMPNSVVHNVLGAIVNATRSTPFIILMFYPHDRGFFHWHNSSHCAADYYGGALYCPRH